ncbi:MAG: CARDB domain-containing protein [Pyrinomonadaceae bacterium]
MTRKMTNITLLFFLLAFTFTVASAQTPTSNNASASIPAPHIEVGAKEAYEVNDVQLVRYKLSVTNRARHPDFLWLPVRHLGSCGKNENPSRTWVEIFGSPGDKRLGGFCALRSSDDLDRLWFVAQSGDGGAPCVYIVMTDRQTGKKYMSNRVCSRSFTAKANAPKPNNIQAATNGDRQIALDSWSDGVSDSQVAAGAGNQAVAGRITSVAIDPSDPGEPANKKAKAVNDNVARDQMAASILRAMGEPAPPRPGSQRFGDVPPSNPFYAFIDRAVALRIIQGCSRTKYCPDEPVPREQMAAFIIRALGEHSPPTPPTQRFADVPPSNPFYAFIELAASRKLLTGCGGGNYCPDQPIKSNETVTALRKAFGSKLKSVEHVSDKLVAQATRPDLKIKQFLFPPTNDKALRVHVANTGQAGSGACRLVLIVRKINGVAVGRQTHVNVPPLAAGSDTWLLIDAKSILPNNIKLDSTTFKLNVDATGIVAESDETNNEVWHNL